MNCTSLLHPSNQIRKGRAAHHTVCLHAAPCVWHMPHNSGQLCCLSSSHNLATVCTQQKRQTLINVLLRIWKYPPRQSADWQASQAQSPTQSTLGCSILIKHTSVQTANNWPARAPGGLPGGNMHTAQCWPLHQVA